MRNPSLGQVCLEILNKDGRPWTRKKRKIEEDNKKKEAAEEKELERFRRLNAAEKQRKELLKTLRKKGVMKPTKTELEAIEKRKIYWRRFREKEEEFEVDKDISEAGIVKNDYSGCTATASEDPLEEREKEEKEKERVITRKDVEYPKTLSL